MPLLQIANQKERGENQKQGSDLLPVSSGASEDTAIPPAKDQVG